MWSLLKAAYGEYGSSSPRSCVGNLDPILCARGAHLRELHKSACAMGASFAADLLRILLEDDGTKSPSDKASCIFFLPTEPRQIKFTNAKYASHFRDLLEWRLLEECSDPGLLHFFSTYFSVPKDDLVDRSIFNGKRLSLLTSVPPPVNLADVPRIIDEMRRMAENLPDGFNVVVGDIRHWFHQIGVSDELARFFGLAMELPDGTKRYFKYRGLPMGWSWSPAIAQAIAWVLLTHGEKGEECFCDMKMEASPMFVNLTHPVTGIYIGFMTIYIDNYLVCCSDDAITQRIFHRIVRNAKIFNIELKQHAMWSKEKLVVKDTSEDADAHADRRGAKCQVLMDFLGVFFGFSRSRNRMGHRDLIWRQKGPKDIVAHALVAGDRTPREVSSTVGRIIYSRLIRLEGLGVIHDVIDVLRRISTIAWKTSWSTSCVSLTAEEKSLLAKEWHHVVHPTWHSGSRRAEPHEIGYVATDACDTGYGYVVFTGNGDIIEISKQFLFDEYQQKWHIFLKEMHGSVEGILRTKELLPGCRLVVNVNDNTAAAGAIRRKYSGNGVAMSMLQRLQTDVQMITVPSLHNCSDASSRGWAFNEAIWDLTWQAVLNDRKGLRSKTLPFGKNPGGIRHAEPEDRGAILFDEELESLFVGQVDIVGEYDE